MEQAERLGVLVLSRESLERIVNQTLVLPDANKLYDEAEALVRAAQAKYTAQTTLRKSTAFVPRYQKFESISPQRRVNELSVPLDEGVFEPGTGVAGVSTKWIGVYGETSGIENGPAGVWGEHKGAGNGVRAISNGGEALVAVSSGKAGVFHGNVDVDGLLTIKGTVFQTVLDHLTKLEALASEIKTLEDKVSQIAEKVVGSVL